LGGALSNFGYLCTVHKHGLCTITYAVLSTFRFVVLRVPIEKEYPKR
jgi:hypothetical protein